MRHSIFSSIAYFIVAVVAQSSSTANPPTVPSSYSVTAGQPSTFTWKPTTNGPVTLTLRSGAASNLNTGTVIASSIPNSGSYTFTLPSDTTRNSDYTIEISADNDPSAVNYTPQFVVESKNTVESITPSASASATSGMTSSTSTDTSSSSETSTSSSASAASATKSSSSSTGSSSSTAASSTSGSSTSTSGSTSVATKAAPAPSNGASVENVLSAQGGLVAVILGAVALF